MVDLPTVITEGDPGHITHHETIHERLTQKSVTEFGATGDGATDDTQAVQDAINAANGNPVWFPAGTYVVNSTLTIPSSGIDIRMANGAVIDTSNATNMTGSSSPLFSASGTIDHTELLSADASQGDTSVSVGDSSQFSVNDLVHVREDRMFANNGSQIGEYHTVRSVSAGVVELRDGLYGNYSTTNSAAIVKVSPVTGVNIQGGKIIGTGSGQNQYGAFFDKVKDVRIANVVWEEFGGRFVEVSGCYSVIVTSCRMARVYEAGLAYGIVMTNGTEHVTISNNKFHDRFRHAIASGGQSTEYGLNRHVAILGNTFTGEYESHVIDGHGNSHNWAIVGNSINAARATDGILYQGVDVAITGNVIKGIGQHGIYHQPLHLSGKSTTVISGNMLTNIPDTGIQLIPEQGGNCDGVTIANNAITTCKHGVRVIPQGSGEIRNMAIGSNAVSNASTNGIWLRAQSSNIVDGAITGNVVQVVGQGIYLFVDTGNILERFLVASNRAYGGDYGVRGVDQANCWVDANYATGSIAGIDGFAAGELGNNRTT